MIDPRDPSQLMTELFNNNSKISERFCEDYSASILNILENIAEAHKKFCLLDKIANENSRIATAAGYAYLSLETVFTSTKLFIHGMTIPSGNLARQSIEALCASVLCGYPNELEIEYRGNKFRYESFFENLMANKSYSRPYKALQILAHNRDKLGINEEAINNLKSARSFFNNYSHPSELAIAAIISLSGDAKLYLGGGFDESKSETYEKEFANKKSYTKIFPNFIEQLYEWNKGS